MPAASPGPAVPLPAPESACLQSSWGQVSPSSWGGPESLTMSGRLLDRGGAAGLGREQQSSQALPPCGYSPGAAQPPLPQAFPSLPGPCRPLQPSCPPRLRAAATTLSQLVSSAGWLPPGLRRGSAPEASRLPASLSILSWLLQTPPPP